MAQPRTLISIRLDPDQLQRLDKLVQQANAKAKDHSQIYNLPALTRSDVIRTMLQHGILVTAKQLQTQTTGT